MASTYFKKAQVAVACALLFGQVTQAHAVGLIQAYQAALQNDPQHRAAIADNQAGQQHEVMGRSALFPQAQFSYSLGKNRGDQTSPDFLGKPHRSDLDYRSSSSGLTIRQTLFNVETFTRYKQSIAQTQLSNAQFDARSKDLMVRVVLAYVEAKYAEDQLALNRAQRDAYAEQKAANDRLFLKGEGTKTDMLETQAKLDVAEASVIESTDNVMNARNALASIMGGEVPSLDSLREGFELPVLVQGSLDEWKTTAERNNPELTAAQLALDIAEQEITKNKGGHAPRLDLNASYSRGKSETLATQKQDSNIRTLGVQLVIPIFSGGYVNAAINQAVAQKEKARADMDATRNKVVNELIKQYRFVKSSEAKIMALRKSVASSLALVEATKQSIKGGIRINIDLLNAQQQLAATQRDLAQAHYGYLASFLRLKVAAGVANLDDLKTIAGFFVAN